MRGNNFLVVKIKKPNVPAFGIARKVITQMRVDPNVGISPKHQC